MAMKLNAYVARSLDGKIVDWGDKDYQYDAQNNPLLSFKNHFVNSRSFTFDFVGEKLWSDLKLIINDPKMPDNPYDYW